MPNHAGIDHDVPDDNANDAQPQKAARTATDTEPSREITSARESTQLRLISALPMLLGVSVLAVNLLVIIRLWRSIIRLPGVVALALTVTSLLAGLFLIVYGLTLRRLDSTGKTISAESRASSGLNATGTYARWIGIPMLVALSASAATVWAAEIAKPKLPDPADMKPCIELYQQALAIHKENPQFRMPAGDRDNARCTINYVLGLA